MMLESARGNWAAKLRRFVASAPEIERCELCGATIGSNHQHLLELASRRLLCACPACSHALAESERFRLVCPQTQALDDFKITDADWDAMQLPIDLVFLFHSTPEGGPVALYPGPAGPMASALSEFGLDPARSGEPATFRDDSGRRSAAHQSHQRREVLLPRVD